MEPTRVVRSKQEARDNYSSLSRFYDFLAGGSEDKFSQEGIQALGLKPGERALEIGFGTGKSLVEMAEAVGSKGVVVGIDLADGMVNVTRKRLTKHQMVDRITLCLGDGAYLPFKDDFFDAVFISFALELFDNPDIVKVINQCNRVLKVPGKIVNVSLKKTTQPNLPEKIYEWLHIRMPVLLDCRPIRADQSLEQGGFDIVKVTTRKMWGLPIDVVEAVKSAV